MKLLKKIFKLIWDIGGCVGIFYLAKDIEEWKIALKSWLDLKDKASLFIMELTLTNEYVVIPLFVSLYLSVGYWSMADDNKLKVFIREKLKWPWQKQSKKTAIDKTNHKVKNLENEKKETTMDIANISAIRTTYRFPEPALIMTKEEAKPKIIALADTLIGLADKYIERATFDAKLEKEKIEIYKKKYLRNVIEYRELINNFGYGDNELTLIYKNPQSLIHIKTIGEKFKELIEHMDFQIKLDKTVESLGRETSPQPISDSPLKIEFERDSFQHEKNHIDVDNGIQDYENVFWCDIYNSGGDDIKNVSVTLIHLDQYNKRTEYDLEFGRFKGKPNIEIASGKKEKVYLVSYKSTLNEKKLYIKRTGKHIDIYDFDFDNTFIIQVTTKGQKLQSRKFAIVVSKEQYIKCRIRYIENQLSG